MNAQGTFYSPIQYPLARNDRNLEQQGVRRALKAKLDKRYETVSYTHRRPAKLPAMRQKGSVPSPARTSRCR
jgi:hypothetical protein